MVRTAIAAKRPSRVLAITDGTAASGLPAGARAMLGGQPITVRDSAAFLDDGTLAGSVSTMDRVFQMLVGPVGLSLVDAATLCSTTPARELGLVGHGVLAVDAMADLLVLDAQLSIVQTYVGGELVYSRSGRTSTANLDGLKTSAARRAEARFGHLEPAAGGSRLTGPGSFDMNTVRSAVWNRGRGVHPGRLGVCRGFG